MLHLLAAIQDELAERTSTVQISDALGELFGQLEAEHPGMLDAHPCEVPPPPAAALAAEHQFAPVAATGDAPQAPSRETALNTHPAARLVAVPCSDGEGVLGSRAAVKAGSCSPSEQEECCPEPSPKEPPPEEPSPQEQEGGSQQQDEARPGRESDDGHHTESVLEAARLAFKKEKLQVRLALSRAPPVS